MLHWLAGQRQPEGPNDPDATGYAEPPETPAPVFAVRAFKHALFGTPQTTQPKVRRNSSTDNARPRNGEPKPIRPGMNRPKSASDAQGLVQKDAYAIETAPSSPTKGILLTPGTAAAKKKNVTFGDHVMDNEGKRPVKTGLPDDCPGNFPGTGSKPPHLPEKGEEGADKIRGRGKLTEALEGARDESRRRKSKGDRVGKKELMDDDDLPMEFAEPKSEDGKYWKHEYDIYRTNTQREVKKLITKQKAAKSYALTKDTQCTELADQLRHEYKKAESLEAKTAELSSQVKDLQMKLHASQKAERKHQDDIAMLKRQLKRKDSARPTSSEGETACAAQLERRKSEQRITQDVIEHNEDPVQRPSEPYKPSAVPEKPKSDLETLRARLKSKTESLRSKANDDIWAQSFGSLSPVAMRSADRPPLSPEGGRRVSSGTDATPLQAIDLNTISNGRETQRQSSLRSLEVECESMPALSRANSQHSGKGEVEPPAEPSEQDLCVPLPSLDIPPVTSGTKQEPVPRKPAEEVSAAEEASLPVPSSSPFQLQGKTLPTRSGNLPAGPRDAPIARMSRPENAKENISPNPRASNPQPELHMKPSAIWSSINATPGSKRVASVPGKDGKEVSMDRLEAARARINARGRVTS